MFILNNLSLINHYIMSKINKIQLSGTVYDIQDLDITKKADTSAVTEALSSKTDTSVFNTYSAATDARFEEDEEVTAAALNVLNDNFGGLKLQQITQSAYDALTTKDASTLYVIVN